MRNCFDVPVLKQSGTLIPDGESYSLGVLQQTAGRLQLSRPAFASRIARNTRIPTLWRAHGIRKVNAQIRLSAFPSPLFRLSTRSSGKSRWPTNHRTAPPSAGDRAEHCVPLGNMPNSEGKIGNTSTQLPSSAISDCPVPQTFRMIAHGWHFSCRGSPTNSMLCVPRTGVLTHAARQNWLQPAAALCIVLSPPFRDLSHESSPTLPVAERLDRCADPADFLWKHSNHCG